MKHEYEMVQEKYYLTNLFINMFDHDRNLIGVIYLYLCFLLVIYLHPLIP